MVTIRALYVEDDQADQYIVRRILKESPLRVDLTTEVFLSAGLERLARETFDVVVLDLDLPDSSYWSPCKALRQMLHQVPETPVIVASNTRDRSLQLRMLEQGAQDFVPKAQLQDQLVRAIEFAIVRGRRLLELRKAATHDELTGLYNRRGLRIMWRYRRRVARRDGKQLAVICADLDGLGDINDTYGHEVGNEALRAAAEALEGCTRPNDIVARVGDDEFVILTTADPGPITKRLRKTVADRNRWKTYTLSISFGAALVRDGDELEGILDRADRRMYEDKADRGVTRSGELESLVSA